MSILSLALESVLTDIEKEKEYYGEIVNPSQLHNASRVIKIEQYGVFVEKTDKNSCHGKFRVRKFCVEGEEPQYELTIKTPLEKGGDLESTVAVNDVMFLQLANIAEGGMIYTRHEFPIEGTEMKWEVDCFDAGNGSFRSWCKIDLELKGDVTEIPSFPIELSNVIIKDKGNSDEEKKKIKDLFETIFTVPNPFLQSK